ncbi:MAG: hypothetical protein A3C79_00645 [Candidatus Taylorbacteria bacterium RIFCSPHIGHO2_02_FULL_45_28]|uniref:Cell shape-determining protein MreC n=1 Tax=Candidatus Taylorbacteria bacterium RIFCSPHIGHO2_12_FULL_45_16 TaxID=1802315 RepID=A0A1G2MZ21_9BACT|nr:MAG: hypothetical protein A2830_01900 [Candidatus Taylorbacteria bacterium RIFCSPHIGHO2_01_FULL_44_110]OHA25528.1 MAG: hypothetical protein A3C79_00645 [Candidatus Taylorbacteria bacterium RIFCSPHIGHO2_02_FULL_45_28]OHA29195.1 MAG: hypothetical protein A3F51_01110 [Candidatus Taylorbacteria bacterium RIFCSPHIGHO2_12_FULL_45_16]OHA33417.1 MAG: hypothetical protein A3A23_01990 [Candidatus Taylorbacteria bacterium RIFCSPLOWO2_01_FULL_45_59]OHA39501.1 MAG: hypothetical protein A3I98_03960 [Candi
MIYLQTHKHPRRFLRQILGLTIVLIVAAVSAIQFFTPHFLPSLFTAVARPFWRVEFSMKSGALHSIESLLNEKELLIRQLSEIRVRLDTIEATELENVELKALLGRERVFSTGTSTIETTTKLGTFEKNGNLGILAAVLKRPPLLAYDEIIIDIGRDYDISTSSLVYAPGDVLIGRVFDVLTTTAKVKFFSSPGELYPISIGPKHSAATAIGRGGGQYEAQVSRDIDVEEGDFVLNSGLNDKPFGFVSAVLLDPTQPFKTVLFASPVNIYQLRWVLIKK